MISQFPVDIAEIVISYRDHKTKMFLFLGSVEGILTCSASTVLTVSEKSFISQKIVVDVRPFLVGDKVQSTKFEFFFFCDIWRNFVSPICQTNFHVFFVSEGPDKVEKTKK